MPYIARRLVEWSDTDAAGIAHFSKFFLFMESAEHEMLRSLGLSVAMREGFDVDTILAPGEHWGWPRTSVKCDFLRPLKHDDEFEVHVSIVEIGERSVTYRCEFFLKGAKIAVGQTTAVCCRITPGSPPKSAPIPEAIAGKLRTMVEPG